MKKILSILSILILAINSLAQVSSEEIINNNSYSISNFIEEIGGIDTTWMNPTRNDSSLMGILPKVFDQKDGEKLFDEYQKLASDFFHDSFYPMDKTNVDEYYSTCIKGFEYDSIETKHNVRESDGCVFENYYFIKDGKRIRYIGVSFIKGIQLGSWEDSTL
jgi:hypothetical protein